MTAVTERIRLEDVVVLTFEPSGAAVVMTVLKHGVPISPCVTIRADRLVNICISVHAARVHVEGHLTKAEARAVKGGGRGRGRPRKGTIQVL